MNFNLENVPPQKGKIAIVTGANNGIGFETTVGLAKVGCKVIMACRSLEKAEIAKGEILARTPEADLEILELDLSKFGSVREFARQFKEKYESLDLLINNAGILDYSGRKNEDGIDLQFATNHLGHYLLTSLLIDTMPDNSDSRIVSLSSVAHKQGKIHFEDINCENTKDSGAAYAQSKLASLMFSDELDRRLKKANRKILAIAVHPGGSNSGLFDDVSRIMYLVFQVIKPFITHSTEDAAKPSLYAALSKDVNGGEYFGPQGFRELKGKVGIAKRTEYSKDKRIASKLWAISEKFLGVKIL